MNRPILRFILPALNTFYMKQHSTLLLASICTFSAAQALAAPALAPVLDYSHVATTHTPHDTEANVTGHVIDKATGQYLPGVIVSVKGTKMSTRTDATGHYFLKDAPVGVHTIEVRAMGYAAFSQQVTLEANKSVLLNIELQAEDLQLSDVVVSATRNATKRTLAPSLVNVMDAKVFEQTQSNDLSQALKFQPGVRVENNCQNCGFSQVRINGLEGPYSQILIDSRPVFSALAGVYGLEQLPTNMIERVEVMRGGGSALFGSNAIAGVINVITKEPTASSASASHELRSLGSFNTFANTTNLNATYVTDNNRLGLTLFGQMRHRSGYDRDGDGFTETPKLDGRTVGVRAFGKFTDYSKLTAELHATNEFRRGGDLLNEEPHNANITEQLRHNNLNGSLAYSQVSEDGHHRINAYASFMKVNRDSYYGGGTPVQELVDLAKKNKTLTKEEAEELEKRLISYGRTNGLTTLIGGQYSYDFDRLFFLPAQFTVGVEHNNDQLDDKSGFRPEFIHQTVNTNSAFLQNEWKNERWSFLLGGRLDKHSMVEKAIFSPRANVRFNPTPNLVLRANYSAGFRAPQIFDEDLHVDNAGGDLILSKNAEDLHEERSHSYSFSADWYTNLSSDWKLNLTAEGFYTQLNDAFSTLQSEREVDGRTTLIKTRSNSDGAKVFGANFEGRLSYRSLFNLQGGLTVQRSEWNQEQQWNEDDSYKTKRFYRTPDVYAYFVSTLTPIKNLNISLSGNFTGSMLAGHEIPTEENGTLKMFNGAPAATIDASRLMMGEGQSATTYGPRTFKTPSFFELGMKVQYTIPIYKYYSLALYGGVQNLTDAFQSDFDHGPDRDSAYVYGPASPRSFYCGFKFTY